MELKLKLDNRTEDLGETKIGSIDGCVLDNGHVIIFNGDVVIYIADGRISDAMVNPVNHTASIDTLQMEAFSSCREVSRLLKNITLVIEEN